MRKWEGNEDKVRAVIKSNPILFGWIYGEKKGRKKKKIEKKRKNIGKN